MSTSCTSGCVAVISPPRMGILVDYRPSKSRGQESIAAKGIGKPFCRVRKELTAVLQRLIRRLRSIRPPGLGFVSASLVVWVGMLLSAAAFGAGVWLALPDEPLSSAPEEIVADATGTPNARSTIEQLQPVPVPPKDELRAGVIPIIPILEYIPPTAVPAPSVEQAQASPPKAKIGGSSKLKLESANGMAQECGTGDCNGNGDFCGTTVAFLASPKIAAEEAVKQRKLLFVLHVSGNFEDPGFT
jgi:hypothetical protein